MNIPTEGIRYAGSKKKLIPEILNMIPAESNYLLDAFSGTTRVAQSFKIKGYNVDSNDLAEYSKIFGNCYLLNNQNKNFYTPYIDILNNLEGIDGWFSQAYGFLSRSPFQIHNLKKLDNILFFIENEFTELNYLQKSILISSLMLALDKVDNTLGHQVAYLKEWSPRSYNNIELKCPTLLYGDKQYGVLQQDSKTIKKQYDLVYLDIPYGTNNEKYLTTRVRYKSYYHLWESICKNDKPLLFGKNGRRLDSSDKQIGGLSDFENTDYEYVYDSIKLLCENLNTKYIIFSYNNKSKIKIKDLIDYFKNRFTLEETKKIPHKENVQKRLTINNNFMGDESENFEYLFRIKK